MKRSLLMLVLPFLILVTGSASAQMFSCGENMVETGVGTTKEEVLQTCGPPTTKGENRWYYENQPGQVTVILYFVNDELQQIEHQPQE